MENFVLDAKAGGGGRYGPGDLYPCSVGRGEVRTELGDTEKTWMRDLSTTAGGKPYLPTKEDMRMS